jgi:membrane protein CcdC involved in cytochrome C biogenesis
MSISYFSLFSLSFIDPTILATVSDLEREKPFTYIKIIYALVFILVTSVIYIWRSAAKLLVSEENGEEKSFGDYFSTLFLLITPFIGVWYIHPRIKNLYSNFQTN